MLLDEPLTSHVPFQPWAPHPHTGDLSSSTERIELRGTDPRNAHPSCTTISVSLTSIHELVCVTPSTTIALLSPVNRIGNRCRGTRSPSAMQRTLPSP